MAWTITVNVKVFTFVIAVFFISCFNLHGPLKMRLFSQEIGCVKSYESLNASLYILLMSLSEWGRSSVTVFHCFLKRQRLHLTMSAVSYREQGHSNYLGDKLFIMFTRSMKVKAFQCLHNSTAYTNTIKVSVPLVHVCVSQWTHWRHLHNARLC